MFQLTPRQREISLLVARGLSNKQIARELGVTEGTIKVHLHTIYERASIANRAALAVLTVRQPVS